MAKIGNIDITYHPIRHLLLLTFLGLSAKEFFENFTEYKPFGDPPYPCLNLAANHYREMKIEECKIFDNISKDISKQGIPIGIFSCECGFTYQRLGPDKSDIDRFSYSRVKEYGDVWESKFEQLWADLCISGGQIGKQMGISQTSVGRQAIRLNLPMNTENTRVLCGYRRHQNPNKSFSQMKAQYRKDWLKVLQEYPELNRKQLESKAIFLYFWFKRNDLEWFDHTLPPPATARVKKDRLNWGQIDNDLLEKVKSVHREILSSKEFPIRICMSEIIRRAGYKTWLEKRHRKLPKTSKFIDKWIETLEDFMLRKIIWAKEKYIEEKKIPTINQFRIRAVLRNSTSENSTKIQQAITGALIEIRNR